MIDSGEVIIAVEGLRKFYGSHEVLRGVDMTVRVDEVGVVIGPSGNRSHAPPVKLSRSRLVSMSPRRPSADSASLPVIARLRRSSRNMWQSVRPDTTRTPRSANTFSMARAFSSTRPW